MGLGMTPSDLLRTLRHRGYTVHLTPDMTVVATGPTPKDPERAAAMLREHEEALVLLLRAEQRQEVKDATEILGATLIRATGVELGSGGKR